MAEIPQTNEQAKKPITRARLEKLLTPAKKKNISVEKPTLVSVSATGGEGKPKPPKAIPTAIQASTYVKPSVLPEADRLKEQKFINTINVIGKNAGIGELKKSSPIYESVRQTLINAKDRGGLVTSKDEEGNPIYVQASTAAEQFSKGWDDFHTLSSKGSNYIFGDEKSNIRQLNASISKPTKLEIPQEIGGLSYLAGRMTMPLAQALPGAVLGTVAPPAGAALTFAISAPDAVYIKYAESLEENYKKAIESGMSEDQAYQASRKIATAAAGGETVLQGLFSTMQMPSMMKPIFQEGTKKAASKTISEYLKRTGNFLKTPTMLGVAGAGTQAITDLESEKQGLQVEDKMSRALENGSSFFLLDFGIKALTNLNKVPGYIKGTMSNAILNSDRPLVRQIVKEGENSGVYPKGTLNKLNQAVDDFAKAKEQSPDYGGDHIRQQVVTGLTQKLNNLLDKQSKLADIHKADLDIEINQIKERIAKAKNVENPLTAELAEDGTPLISQQEQSIEQIKTQEDATTTSKKQVEESVPASSVSEYKGAETVEKQAANEADNRNSLVGGKTTQEEITDATQKAEAQMQGIKTEDASELMRIARRAYDKEEAPNFEGIVKIMRNEMESKVDLSNVSDDTLMKLAEDAASKSEKYQFKAGPAKRIPLPQETYAKDQILTNPREVFKSMYSAAEKAGKSIQDRLKMAAEAIAEARKGKGLDIDVNKIQSSISKFVTAKMDTETAAESFADNIDDIIRDAENVKTNTANKGLIKDIKKASKSKTYGTVATRETTQGIDFISSNKVEDPSEYNRLLSDYKKSITGEITEGEGARQKLIDYVDAERQKHEAITRAKLEKKYDSLVEKGEPPMTTGENPRVITKDEYVEVMTNPQSKKTSELEGYEYNVNESKAEVMKEMTDVRQGMLKEAINNGEIDDDIVESAKEIANVDVNKVQPKNIKLLNNIIEDVMNGEQPSRWNEIVSDVERFDKVKEAQSIRIRNIIGARTIGAINKVKKLFGYKGDKSKYDLLNIGNIIRNATFNDTDASALSKIMLGDFNMSHTRVVNISKNFAKNVHDIFTEKTITIGNRSYKFSSPRLTELNSYRMGIASVLSQVSDIPTNLQTIGNMIINLSKIAEDNYGENGDMVKHVVDALKSFDLIESITYSESGKAITSIRFKDDANINSIVSNLNDRELFGIQYARNEFKALAPDLDNSLRNNFGETLDMSNKDYLPFTAFFTGDNKVIDLEGDIFDGIPEQMRTMRAGTTMDRNKNLVGETMRNGKVVNVNYDFNFFSTMQKRYHESLNTAYTAKDVKTLSKLINDKDFQNVLAGKSGINPKNYIDNVDVLNSKIKNYVNMQRSPYILTDAQKQQRSRFSKFVYGKLLNSWKQLFKQSIPSISYTITEAGILPFLKANEFIFGSLGNDDYREALKTFLRQTSMSDRDLGGFEAYADALANLDDSKLARFSKDAFDKVFEVTSMPLSVGDKYASISSLIVGYMKGLKAFGKITEYGDVDLINVLKQPLDKDALAYAENFQSIVNNSSNAASRAKVLREKNSAALRLLQSYNLNQWANFNIDFGRLTDPMSTSSDRVAAAKRLSQYFVMGGMFGYTAYQLAELDKKAVNWAMNQSGLDLYPEDVDKTKEISDRDATRFLIGTGVDMMTGGMNLMGSQAFKFGIESAFLYGQSKAREEQEKMGKITKNTWLASDFNPIYRSNFIALNGTFLEDADRFLKMVNKKEDTGAVMTEENQKMSNYIDITKGVGLVLPIKDVESIVNVADRNLKRLGMTQEEKDMFMFSNARNKSLSPMERQEAVNYLEERQKQSPDFNSYLQNKIIPKYVSEYQKQVFMDMAKMFGKQKGKEMYSISKMSGDKLYMVMNNRYPGIDLKKDKELMFMVQYGGITPEEYATAIAYDKDGKVRIDQTNEELINAIRDRYAIADMLSPSDQYSKVRNKLTADELVTSIVNLRNKRQRERDIIR
jgi:hypothetical protein